MAEPTDLEVTLASGRIFTPIRGTVEIGVEVSVRFSGY